MPHTAFGRAMCRMQVKNKGGRKMSVYTARGDKGMTDLFTGQRIAKNSWRVKAYGALDEFGSALGMARAFCENEEVRQYCLELQKLNGLLMTDFASANNYEPNITHEHVVYLENAIDKIEEKLSPLKGFLIPGESKGGACLDLARTISRRAERVMWDLTKNEVVPEEDSIFLNRISDFCFMLMRLEENR